MIRKEEYKALMARLDNPENSGLREKLSPVPAGHNLAFHLKRIKDYVEYWEENDSITRELLEQDYTVSLRNANKLMDEQGWK